MIRIALNPVRLLFVMVVTVLVWYAWGAEPSTALAQEKRPGSDTALVQFEADVSDSERDALIRQMGGELIAWLAPLHTAQIRLSAHPSSARSTEDLLAWARSSRHVRLIERDGKVQGLPLMEGRQPVTALSLAALDPLTINDPAFNNPQYVYAPGVIQLAPAWHYTTGRSDIVIAVVDTGVMADHPDLAGQVRSDGYDFVNDDADPADDHGHGTHVSGIIAAKANNGYGSAGICPNCTILPVKVLNENNTGSWFAVAQGIIYAVDHGARVINLSLGASSAPATVADAVAYARERNVLVVSAAGNGRSDAPFYPAAYDGVLAVSATRNDDTLWSLSNYGDFIDVAAPGYAIYSTYIDLNNFYRGFTFMSGTSMASPHVAGLAGLLLSQDPARTAVDLADLIEFTADDLGDPGWDPYFGYGRINALAALEAASPQPAAIAGMGGIIWQDVDGNGHQDSAESGRLGQVTVEIRTNQGELVITAQSHDDGCWQADALAAGEYAVQAVVPDGLVITSQPEYQVELAVGQQLRTLNFGLVAAPSPLPYKILLPVVAR